MTWGSLKELLDIHKDSWVTRRSPGSRGGCVTVTLTSDPDCFQRSTSHHMQNLSFEANPFLATRYLPPCTPSTTGHKDSVTCATFSHDSSLVATGDMGGLIKVWKVESKEEIWSFEVGDLEVKLRLFSWCIWEHLLGSLFFFFYWSWRYL